MSNPANTPRRGLYWLMMIAMVVVSVGAVLLLGTKLLRSALHDEVLAYYVANLSEEQKQQLYQEVAGMNVALWDAAPEPGVAVLGRRDHETVAKGAQIRLNNAGFRSSVPFEPKDPDRFRIVCLGDSFVFGSAGREQDRFCNQLQDFYETRNIRVDGRRIETYAVGLDGWSAVQESTYMSSRLSAFEPDVIVLLSVGNDFTSLFGVTGTGLLTGGFSPEYRQWGSGVFWHKAAQSFGWRPRSALVTDLGPEGRAVWQKGMHAIASLVEKQQRRGGRILLSFMQRTPSYESELYRSYLAELAIPAPYITTGFFPDEGHRLPHDNHPNRDGYAVIADHYVHTLAQLGWVEVPQQQLPPLHAELSLVFEARPDENKLARHRAVFIKRHLRRVLDFCCMEPAEAAALLGGVMLDRSYAKHDTPWASVRSGFLMQRERGENETLELVIEIPDRMELFPFRLEIRLDGSTQSHIDLASVDAAGRHVIHAPLPVDDDNDVIEVVLVTASYFADIEDARMKSFRLVSAQIRRDPLLIAE